MNQDIGCAPPEIRPDSPPDLTSALVNAAIFSFGFPAITCIAFLQPDWARSAMDALEPLLLWSSLGLVAWTLIRGVRSGPPKPEA